ncbi:hypothetical protein GJ631_08765 [Natronomonas sp. CBA1123]|uniref:hypothetical protein n=1 Tax=Natronomonas sp. CBA1123 TaxID=2668070 RepID=UPI0012EA43C5|nr:hypothetical protein [Natronomonas sp. CBA1123]MUV86655.1 hypothetical protein [Natronomonas sp. CBA1123]
MKRRSVLASMGAFTASGSLVMGSGAFTSAEVERDVNIDVVGDPYAFLGLRYPNEDGTYPTEDEPNATPPETLNVTSGEEQDLFHATNQFAGEITGFSLSVDERGDEFDSIEVNEKPPDEFTPGEDAFVTVEIDCNGNATEEVVFGIEAEGEGFSVSAQRRFEISCSLPTAATTAPRFTGGGQFKYDESLDGKTLRAWYRRDGTVYRTGEQSGEGESVELNDFDGVSGRPTGVFAIEFVEDDSSTFFIRRTFLEADSCDVEQRTTDAVEKSQTKFCDEIADCELDGQIELCSN